MDRERIVAIGLLTRNDLTLLGPAFDRAWPIEEEVPFRDLLDQIDRAEQRLLEESDA